MPYYAIPAGTKNNKHDMTLLGVETLEKGPYLEKDLCLKNFSTYSTSSCIVKWKKPWSEKHFKESLGVKTDDGYYTFILSADSSHWKINADERVHPQVFLELLKKIPDYLLEI